MASRRPNEKQKLLRTYMEKRGESFASLGEKVGRSKTAISFMVNGRPDGQPYMGYRGGDPLYWAMVDELRIPRTEAQAAANADAKVYADNLAQAPPRRRKRSKGGDVSLPSVVQKLLRHRPPQAPNAALVGKR